MMRRNLATMFASFLMVFASGIQSASAQANPSSQSQTTPSNYLPQPEVPNSPMFMIDTLEIKAITEPRYWKVPNQNDNSSWYPQVSFDVFYDNSVKLRYTAEWFNPNGSPWFSESLQAGFLSVDKTIKLSSPRSTESLNSKAVQTTGTYGLKITNAKSGEVVFQGKFKVNKLQPEANLKNKFLFYVDNDWHLAVGYVGFDYAGTTSWEDYPRPIVFLWFKGNLDSDDLEARLFYNNQQIASTDEGGGVNTEQKRGEACYEFRETCAFTQWYFYWNNFIVQNADSARLNFPKATFTKDKPGEYTVKIFHKGVQVREVKFIIDAKGWVAPNAFSKQVYLTNYKVVVPVKVMGNLEKWNVTAWKTDAFYGNPLDGFIVP